jgi:hypothetical protein
MTTTLTHFGLTENQVIRKDNNFYLPVSHLAKVLKVEPRNIQRIIKNHVDEFFHEGATLCYAPIETKGGIQQGYLLDVDQVSLLCMLVRSSDKAKQFRKALITTMKQIRTREFVHISEVNKIVEGNKLLASLPPATLTKYKKIREFGLSRKQACRALVLPYSKMREIDKLLGYYKPNPAAKALIPYYFKSKSGGIL